MLKDKIRRSLAALPGWTLSVLTLAVIMWLTLVPDPFGDDSPSLFPGADKLVHALMFGFLALMILLDIRRRNAWRGTTLAEAVAAAVISTSIGVLIEFLQLVMALGRGFEVADMLADFSGSVICVFIWQIFQEK